ncbi:MAG: CYTH domain-containing protein [Firmicutes bacterium]|nr:CYTH domain-containing protein [Bacillota bacterium]
MEIELKFLVEESFTRDRILNDQHLLALADGESLQAITMKAIYLDTEDRKLLEKKIAFRVRFEDERLVATLKWGGDANNGLHTRGELNAAVEETFLEHPSLDIFRGSTIYEEIGPAMENVKLFPVMKMDFVRKQMHIDTGKSISVLSYDEGEIRTVRGAAPISELEIELYSGDQQDMMALGQEIAAKYNLKPENKSKYQRGLELLGITE